MYAINNCLYLNLPRFLNNRVALLQYVCWIWSKVNILVEGYFTIFYFYFFFWNPDLANCLAHTDSIVANRWPYTIHIMNVNAFKRGFFGVRLLCQNTSLFWLFGLLKIYSKEWRIKTFSDPFNDFLVYLDNKEFKKLSFLKIWKTEEEINRS